MSKIISMHQEKLKKRAKQNATTKKYIKERRAKDPLFAQKLRDYQRERYTSKGYGKRYNELRRIGKVTHVCPQCLKEFEAGPVCVFCSSKCNNNWRYQNIPTVRERTIKYQKNYRPGYIKLNREKINAKARIPKFEHICKECGNLFVGKESKEFCKPYCKIKHESKYILPGVIIQGASRKRGTKEWIKFGS